MLTNDINNDQKGRKVDTIDSTTQKKRSHAMKMIQKYNVFQKWRWDAQDMLAGVKNKTPNFD